MNIGFMGLLTLLFIAAKLFGAITWPWLWVLAPLWGTFIVSVVLGTLYAIAVKLTD
jgi:hypothetical protein